MSNLEDGPREAACPSREGAPQQSVTLTPREVPLGGARAMTVRRTLPNKQIRTVGAWCFIDHYGPQVHDMSVPPHPHFGLQTVTWLMAGEVEHRDSIGSVQTIRPGQVNVMTAGRGIAHSEYSSGGLLHGVQLWVALTADHRNAPPAFEHVGELPRIDLDGLRGIVFMGDVAGVASPARAYSPIVGAEITVAGPADLPLEPAFEHAVLAVDGDVVVDGVRVDHGAAQYLGTGRECVRLVAPPGSRVLLLGGEPLAEDLLMWWNFVGRSHDEIVEAREQWEAGHGRFGAVRGDPNPRLPAPAMPTVELRPRPSRRA